MLRLRNNLLGKAQQKAMSTSTDFTHAMAAVVRVWNARRAGRSISQPLMDIGCRDHGGGHHMLSATGAAGKMTLATEVSGATLSERSVLDATFAKTGAAT